jgi:thiamine biosynthesis lipoprotein
MLLIERETQAISIHKKILRLMGNRFEISVVHESKSYAEDLIDLAILEIRRIEALLTTFNNESQTNKINRNAGVSPVEVDQEVFDLIQRSKKVSSLTSGAFDLSYGSIDKSLWNFDMQITSLPDQATAKKMVHLINYSNIILDEKNKSVFLKEKGMRIGFGGIGKGYAADRAKLVLAQNHITSGIVNAAGDLITWGFQPDGKPWTIGIADPDNSDHPFSYLNISDKAVATSGNYEKFVIIDGKKYSHTINPATGYPVSGIKSVTIISPYAEIADAMATPVMVMGVRAGLDLINQVKNLACIIIDDDNKLHTSNNIKITQ